MAIGDRSLPTHFGPFELLARLGRGGMGQVFLARRRAIAGAESLCVVKTLRADLSEDAEYARRFLDEVRVAMQLRHSTISHVFDAGQLEGEYYMAMEYLAGVSLREVWKTADRIAMPMGLAFVILEDVLDGLDYAHRHKNAMTGAALHVVHRDVSPQNVIVTFEGEVKVIDFGLAESSLKEEETESQIVMGKVAYMSPEQARGLEVNARADQFAAGVILCELLLGQRFYGARSNAEIWQIVGRGGYLPEGISGLDEDLQRVVARALAARPEDRWPDCAAFRRALEAVHIRLFPGDTRSTLRDWMDAAFHREREKTFAVVRAAGAAAEAAHAVEMTVSSSSRRDVRDPDDDASSSVPSRTSQPAAWLPPPPNASAASVQRELVDAMPHFEPTVSATASASGEREAELTAPGSVTEFIAREPPAPPARSRGPALGVSALLVVALGVGAVLAVQALRSVDDEGAVARVEPPEPTPEPEPDPEPEPEPEPVVEDTPDPPPVTTRTRKRRARRAPPESTTVTPEPESSAPAPRSEVSPRVSLQAVQATLRGCDKLCAARFRAKGADLGLLRQHERLARNCYRQCRK